MSDITALKTIDNDIVKAVENGDVPALIELYKKTAKKLWPRVKASTIPEVAQARHASLLAATIRKIQDLSHGEDPKDLLGKLLDIVRAHQGQQPTMGSAGQAAGAAEAESSRAAAERAARAAEAEEARKRAMELARRKAAEMAEEMKAAEDARREKRKAKWAAEQRLEEEREREEKEKREREEEEEMERARAEKAARRRAAKEREAEAKEAEARAAAAEVRAAELRAAALRAEKERAEKERAEKERAEKAERQRRKKGKQRELGGSAGVKAAGMGPEQHHVRVTDPLPSAADKGKGKAVQSFQDLARDDSDNELQAMPAVKYGNYDPACVRCTLRNLECERQGGRATACFPCKLAKQSCAFSPVFPRTGPKPTKVKRAKENIAGPCKFSFIFFITLLINILVATHPRSAATPSADFNPAGPSTHFPSAAALPMPPPPPALPVDFDPTAILTRLATVTAENAALRERMSDLEVSVQLVLKRDRRRSMQCELINLRAAELVLAQRELEWAGREVLGEAERQGVEVQRLQKRVEMLEAQAPLPEELAAEMFADMAALNMDNMDWQAPAQATPPTPHKPAASAQDPPPPPSSPQSASEGTPPPSIPLPSLPTTPLPPAPTTPPPPLPTTPVPTAPVPTTPVPTTPVPTTPALATPPPPDWSPTGPGAVASPAPTLQLILPTPQGSAAPAGLATPSPRLSPESHSGSPAPEEEGSRGTKRKATDEGGGPSKKQNSA
ncbi:hypothetical protein D9615_005921 [Tricholomella constricta]|uniref:Zn(2)-C6 fungal-type domain-containing protein n=1 Tax=Tricholomella constricta TaxID=117010 RepID=A0A8H5H9L3_9AGAR|nr:hypothetical protein D9615_005921 [Tricholomella constricta]